MKPSQPQHTLRSSDGRAVAPATHHWTVKREITLGHLLQIVALVLLLVAGWSNLQKDLALIQHDLTRLISNHQEFHSLCEKLSRQCQEHEYRIRRLEETASFTDDLDPEDSENESLTDHTQKEART